jgi:pimeloyl-ACP methyl ester carboxylesterase
MNKSHFEEKSIQTENGKIFYHLDMTFPNRPVVVLLHGLSSNHTTWLDVMEVLREYKFNTLAPDLRGHGLSDKTKKKDFYTLPVFSNDLREIFKKEKIGESIIVGYSFGGQVAIDFVARFPKLAKGLILISVNHYNPFIYRGLGFFEPICSWLIDSLATILLWQKRKNYHYYEHGKSVGYWSSVWDGLRTMPISVNLWMLANAFDIDLRKEVKKIKIPTTIVCGENDAFITGNEVNDVAKAIKGSEVIVSKNPDHFVGSNSQHETTEIILKFLSNLNSL